MARKFRDLLKPKHINTNSIYSEGIGYIAKAYCKHCDTGEVLGAFDNTDDLRDGLNRFRSEHGTC